MLSFPSIVDPVRDILNSHVRHFSKLVGWSTVIVAIGVALEGVEIVHDVIAWMKRRSREKSERAALREISDLFPASDVRGETESHSDHPRWVKRLLRLGLIMVVVGVVGEWRCGAKLEDAHNAVHEYDLAKLTEADQKAGDAATSAKIAHEEADAVKSIADEARADAKDALAKAQMAQAELAHAEADSAKAAATASDAFRMARTVAEEVKATKKQADEIRDEIAWRHISPEDVKKIRDALPASLNGYKIEVRHLLSDPEAAGYAADIANALRPKLDVNGTSGYLAPWGTIPQGVGIYVKSPNMPGAGDIQRALKAGGVEAMGALLSAVNLSSATGIVIFVWPKPAPANRQTNKQSAKP
jgi:hypothetical protein